MPHALFLDCRDKSNEIVPFDVAAAGLVTLVVDTRVAHAHADGGYASRRRACEFGAEVLGVNSLRDVSVSDLDEAHRLLHAVAFRRVRRVVTENQRVLDSTESAERLRRRRSRTVPRREPRLDARPLRDLLR